MHAELADGRSAWIPRQDLQPAERTCDPAELVGSWIRGALITPGEGRHRTVVSPRELARSRLDEALAQGRRLRGYVLLPNRGGAIVDADGIQAFLPRAEMRRAERRAGTRLAGRRWRGYVVVVSRRRFVVSSYSERVRRRRLRARRRWGRRHRPGDVVRASVASLAPTGVVVRVHRSGVEAFVPGSEMAAHPAGGERPIVGARTTVRLLSLSLDGEHGPIVVASQRLRSDAEP